MDQWFIRITKYAEELLNEIKHLNQWPDRIRIMQEHWIGKSERVLKSTSRLRKDPAKKIRVFTTRPDTVFGVCALILAPEHPLCRRLIDKAPPKSKKSKSLIETVQRDGKRRALF